MDTPIRIRQLVIEKFKDGLTQMSIANQLHVNQSIVSRIISRYKQTGGIGVTRKGICGRKRMLSHRTDRLIGRASLSNPKATAADIQKSVRGEAISVSLSTVKRSLRRSGGVSYRPIKSPSWTLSQMRVRLKWAMKHRYWTINDWKKVFITSYFSFR